MSNPHVSAQRRDRSGQYRGFCLRCGWEALHPHQSAIAAMTAGRRDHPVCEQPQEQLW